MSVPAGVEMQRLLVSKKKLVRWDGCRTRTKVHFEGEGRRALRREAKGKRTRLGVVMACA